MLNKTTYEVISVRTWMDGLPIHRALTLFGREWLKGGHVSMYEHIEQYDDEETYKRGDITSEQIKLHTILLDLRK